MSTWKLTVGMEIHVELETKTKMFCGCVNDPFGSAPNIHVCPVCYGLPGALPLINKEAVKKVIRFGQAIHATIPTETFWERKSYFYPDLPKGYQLSQSVAPLVQGGVIVIDGVEHRLHHAHLEEDAGKLMHAPDKSHSLVNYNRAGVPLLEIVTEPDFHSAESVKRFCQELQRIMRSLQISSADMEKGFMRCEANISVSNTEELGTKVEVKNINSFRSVEKAIQYEFDRQTKALEAGERLVPETRTWNDAEGKTVSMRTKETSADYRYFPEPDLPIVRIEVGESAEHLLPEDQRQVLLELGLNSELVQPVIDKGYFELVNGVQKEDSTLTKEAAKALIAFGGPLTTAELVEFLRLKAEHGWTNDTAKAVLAAAQDGGVAQAATQFTHSVDLAAIVQEVVEQSDKIVADYRSGKTAAFQALVGQVMAKTKGCANVQKVREELERQLQG